MSISRQNLTAIIVTFKSEEVIHDCINSIDSEIKILVVDNSNDTIFKNKLESKYKNVTCILSKKNIGMGAGNNLGIKFVTTDFVLILNPDVILEKQTINEIINASEQINSFGIIAPMEVNKNYPNYKLGNKLESDSNNPFNVKSVDGYAMVLNLKRLNQIDGFNYFDENFFMYLENDDFCKRIIKSDENIYVAPKSKIKHLGAKAVSKKFYHEVELSRNWHWTWSKFYFLKKHSGYVFAFGQCAPKFLTSMIKCIFYFIFRNKFKSKIYYNRSMGFFNSIIGKSSWYRPKID
jgi:GT2 family glycosyltransferase